VSAFEALNGFVERFQKLSFGCQDLDRVTDGGLSTRGINEICGEAGTGKTQMCLQLALMAQLPRDLGGTGKGAVYICTEESFNSRRLLGMFEGIYRQFPNVRETYTEQRFLNNIFIMHITSEIESCIIERLPKLLAIRDVGLVVIDSITGPFMEMTNYIERAESLRKLVHTLHKLSEQYNFAIVCTNQVRSIPSILTEDHEDLAAMSLSWSTLVHSRFQLYRLPNSSVRKFHIVFSPTLPQDDCLFTITAEGIQGIKI
jgi:DNA-repair protein XRCC3